MLSRADDAPDGAGAPSKPRLRFAPAPTGLPHLGTSRTALFNWLYARHCGGDLLLRIEDTNAELATAENVTQIREALAWLGLDFDGEPIFQSQRAHLYDAAVERWLDEGRAYLDDGAVRFRVPDEGVTTVDDVVRGRVEFPNDAIDDFVVRRSDGSATFFVANAVDDLDLGITHVVRGEDLLNTTPKVVMLREALASQPSAPPPVFAHLPLIVGRDGKKLSKRRDDVSLFSYRDRGVMPDAMANYLALLGWGPPDDQEIRPLDEIAELFDLADVNASPATFDIDKLTAINGAYIRELDDHAFAAAITPWVRDQAWGAQLDAAQLARSAPLIRERTRLLADAPDRIAFLFSEPEIDADAWAKAMVPPAADILARVRDEFARSPWQAEALHATLRDIGAEFGLKLGVAQAPVRVAVTGATVGPPLFESLELLGRDTALARLDASASTLERAAAH